jgi:protein-tyrosine phosphatase
MPLLTSHTHPLCIDVVDVPDGGQIGMTLCPGKKQPNSVSGHWQRDLATDLKAVADWGATAVVTLMEPKELEWVAVADMGEMVESLGMDWYHLPIRDVQPPGMRFENRWVLYGLLLRRRLRRGEKVLIHCRGGLGRTGTVAGRLLAELGMRPSAGGSHLLGTAAQQVTGAVGLGVQVHHQGLPAAGGADGRQVTADGGFAYAPFLVEYDATHDGTPDPGNNSSAIKCIPSFPFWRSSPPTP